MAIQLTEDNAFEEKVNAAIHASGFLLSLPAMIYMLVESNRSRPELWYSCLAYCISLCAVYLFSTLSHAVRDPAVRHRMRSLDQGVIYLLVSGTYTPFVSGFLTGWLKVATLVAIWIAAFLGFYSKVIAKHRVDTMVSTNYVLLGWGPALVLFSFVSSACFGAMALGGLMYTLGTYFLHNDHRQWYYHAIWHLLVVAASLCHYASILYFVIL